MLTFKNNEGVPVSRLIHASSDLFQPAETSEAAKSLPYGSPGPILHPSPESVLPLKAPNSLGTAPFSFLDHRPSRHLVGLNGVLRCLLSGSMLVHDGRPCCV